MTLEEFDKLVPRKSLIKYNDKIYLLKFFACNSENFDGYFMVVTEDHNNPYPGEITDDDLIIYYNSCELV